MRKYFFSYYDEMKYKKRIQHFLNTPSDKQKLVVIYGPTGAGKTDMSIEIAKQLDSEIISTDSRQIFTWMDIWTGKITTEEMQDVPHHMLDVIFPDQSYSVWEFVASSQKIIDNLYERWKIPMLVWGTGLYIDSLIFKRAFWELPNDPILKKNFAKFSTQELYNELQEIDPEYAEEIHPNNRPYIERALEVKKLSWKSKKDFRSEPELKYDVLFLHPSIWEEDDIFSETYRQLLYARINKRVGMMFDMWLEEEIRQLVKEGFHEDHFGMKSIGYAEFFSYFRWEIGRDEVQEKIKQHSRNYAKRQLTWFRKYQSFIDTEFLKAI